MLREKPSPRQEQVGTVPGVAGPGRPQAGIDWTHGCAVTECCSGAASSSEGRWPRVGGRPAGRGEGVVSAGDSMERERTGMERERMGRLPTVQLSLALGPWPSSLPPRDLGPRSPFS